MKNQKSKQPKPLTTTSEKTNNSRRSSLPNFRSLSVFSPATPHFLTPQLGNFNEEEVGEVLDKFINKGQKASAKILNKLLEEKENEIKRLEAEKQQWLDKEKIWEQKSLKHQQTQSKFTKHIQELEQLKTELNQTNDDLYQTDQKNQELNAILQQEKLNNRQLEERLVQEVDENVILKKSQKKINHNLLTKINELTQLKKLNQQEREQCKNIIAQQSEQYEQERKEREQKFTQQINNLRTFQLTADIPNKFKRTHKTTFSTSSLPTSHNNSPRNSTYTIEDDRIIFSSSPSPSPLLNELNRQGYQEKSGIINSDFTTTPQEEANPFESEEKKTKRYSNSPLFVRSPSPKQENIDDVLEKLLGEVANLEEEKNQGQQEEIEKSELINELTALKKNQAQLEKNYKVLADEKIDHERALKSFNEKELAWERERAEKERLLQQIRQQELTLQNDKQKLTEELAETRYKLAETEALAQRTDKQNKKTFYSLKEQHKGEIQEWQAINAKLADNLAQEGVPHDSLSQLEEAVNRTHNKTQQAQQLFSEFKAQILDINNRIIKK